MSIVNEQEITVGVVIVTYNRVEKLKKALLAYDNQKQVLKYILVVDNASNDSTKEFLNEWKSIKRGYDKYFVTLNENTGGSGGFFVGEKLALSYEADWIMLADDDAYPEPDYIKGLLDYIKIHKEQEFSAVCGSVLENGSVFNNHRSKIANLWKWHYRRVISNDEYNKESVSIEFMSYVGVLLNKEKLKKVGLVNKDYFIWNDDVEHSIRLRKEGIIVYVPQYVIYHDCDVEHVQLSWKSYYGYRNQLDLFRKHYFKQFLFCLIVFSLKTILCPLKGRSLTEVKLRLHAIYDGIHGNLGKHNLYKPGWKP